MNKPQTLRAWLDNFWYHHKWQTIFVLFILSVIVICVLQMDQVTTFDAQVLYTGPHIFTAEEKASVEAAFTQLLEKDYNGDGLKNCQLADLTIFSNDQLVELLKNEEDPAEILKYNQFSEDARAQSFAQEITAGEHIICLLDPYWFNRIKEKNGLVDLKHVLPSVPENQYGDYGIRLKDTDFGKYFEVFDHLPDDTILCLRILSSSMILSQNKEAEQRHIDHQQILTTVVSFTLPEGFVPRETEA